MEAPDAASFAVVQVFISYSWDGLAHSEWVKALANRLRNDGIVVVIDTTDVRPGVELPRFMETSVRDSDFVLVICTEKYKLRADDRTGGVGFESRLLSAEVFVFGDRGKVIPILRGADWPASAPAYLLGTTYVDLRDAPHFESEYLNLVEMLKAADRGSADAVPSVRIPEIESPSLGSLREAADTQLRANEEQRTSFDAAREMDQLRSRIEQLEHSLRRNTSDPELGRLLSELDRLDLDFVHWSGVALEELDNVRARPEAMVTIDFSEIHRYMHFAGGGALASFAIAILRKVGQPLYMLPGTLLELRGYLESRRNDYSDRDGILRRLAEGDRSHTDLLLQRHAPLRRLARLLDDSILVPWHGTMPELSEVRYVLGRFVRSSPIGPNYVDAMNLVMVKELRRERPAAHLTATTSLLRMKDEIVTAADTASPFPLVIHTVQWALANASKQDGFPVATLSGFERQLLTARRRCCGVGSMTSAAASLRTSKHSARSAKCWGAPEI